MSAKEGDDMVGELEGEGGVVVELCMSGEEGDDMVGELGRERGEICVSGEKGVGIIRCQNFYSFNKTKNWYIYRHMRKIKKIELARIIAGDR